MILIDIMTIDQPLYSVEFRLEFLGEIEELQDDVSLQPEDGLHVLHRAEDLGLGDRDGEDDGDDEERWERDHCNRGV